MQGCMQGVMMNGMPAPRAGAPVHCLQLALITCPPAVDHSRCTTAVAQHGLAADRPALLPSAQVLHQGVERWVQEEEERERQAQEQKVGVGPGVCCC